jgi:biotin carboxylase
MVLVLYAAPNYTESAVKFIDKLASIPDIRFGLISQEPVEWLKPEVRAKLSAFYRVQNAFDTDQLLEAARWLSNDLGPIHRIIGASEQVQLPVAQVRDAMKIPGMSYETMLNFRDKSRMKNLLHAANLPCARHKLAASTEEAMLFAEENGFPLIVKPPDGAASQSTFKVGNVWELKAALSTLFPTTQHPVLLEEFITGDEHSFDTFSLNGKPLFHSLTHYYPNPLEVIREPWIQWQVVLPREIDIPQYDDIQVAAYKTLETLGMQTGLTHLEWFRRKDGSIAISEVAARPPGAQITTLIARANDIDCITTWARLMIFGEFQVPERKYAVGAAYLRGQGQGRVVAVNGLEEVNEAVGHLITDVKIPHQGQEKGLTYEGEGFIILRHPETAVVKEALLKVVSTVQVILG